MLRVEIRRCIHHQGVILLIVRSIQQSLKGVSFQKSSVHYFKSLGTCDLCLQKLPNLKDSNRLPGEFIAGESITNTNNSMNTQNNSKSFLGMPIGTRRSCLMKKTGHEKSHDTVLLSPRCTNNVYSFTNLYFHAKHFRETVTSMGPR